MKIPVITLWQPWASWIVLGLKTIETRTHPRFACLAGKRIYIHAGAKWDESALMLATPFLTPSQLLQTTNFYETRSAIIGSAIVSEFRELIGKDSKRACIDCTNTLRYGLILSDVKAIQNIPIKGKQGIWYYDTLASR
jgi:hypothetical protein